MKRLIQAAAFVTPLLLATSAFAATAIVTTGLHLRTGPSAGYPVITSMPDGAIVHVSGCVRGYSWCEVDWSGYRGWAAADYLAFTGGRYRHRAFSHYGARIGIPLIAGVVIGDGFHGHHHWHHHRHVVHHQRRVIRHQRHRIRHLRHHDDHGHHHGHGHGHGHDNGHDHHHHWRHGHDRHG